MKNNTLLTVLLFFCFIPVMMAGDSAPVREEQPFYFIENKGQVKGDGKDILFVLRGKGVEVFVGKNSLHYVFTRCDLKAEPGPSIYTSYRTDMYLLGANPEAEVRKEEPQDYYENYYNVPSHPEGITHVNSFTKLVFENVYPGIDWVLYTRDGQLKYDFVIRPGADHRNIRMRYHGAEEASITSSKTLQVSTPLGKITEEKPFTYQAESGKEIASAFELMKWIEGSEPVYEVQFDISSYSGDRTLIIDPGLVWATHYGGAYDEQIDRVITDRNNDVYIAGHSNTGTNISFNGHQNNWGGYLDAFLVKFNPEGKRLWATYYGGTEDEAAYAIATDGDNNILLTGTTYSSGNIAYRAYQGSLGGSYDIFIAKFTSAGTRIWGTYYGGVKGEFALDICADAANNFYLSGYTFSANAISKIGYRDTLIGSSDNLLAKFDSTGALMRATYYGGENQESGGSLLLDAAGNIYLSGNTFSSTRISHKISRDSLWGGSDLYLVKFDPSFRRIWATYIGGNDDEYAFHALAFADSNIVIGGSTSSGIGISSSHAHQDTFGGNNFDGFVVLMDTSGKIRWGSYFGGEGNDDIYAVAATSQQILLAGQTTSSSNIYFGEGYSETVAGGFFASLDITGKGNWGSYFGVNTSLLDIHADDKSGIYVVGKGSLYNMDTTAGAFQSHGKTILAKFNEEHYLFMDDVPAYICGDDSLQLHIRLSKKFDSTNYIRLQLSDGLGSFNAPLLLDSFRMADKETRDKFYKGLSKKMQQLSGYRFRVISSSPADTFESKIFYAYPGAELKFSTTPGYCKGDTAVLSVTNKPGNKYKWYFNGAPVASGGDTTYTLYTTTLGLYNVRVTNSYNCQATLPADTLIGFGDKPLAWFSVNDTVQCDLGHTFYFTDQSIAATSNPIAIQWWLGNGDSSFLDNPVIKYKNPGIYEVKLIARSYACRDTAVLPVQVLPNSDLALAVTDGIPQGCFGDSVVLAADQTPGNSYRWYRNDVPTANADDTLPVLLIKDNAEYKVLISNSNSCVFFSDSVDTYFNSKPVLDFTPADTACTVNNNVNFQNTSAVANDSLLYEWDFGDGTYSTDESPAKTYLASGKYTIRMVTFSLFYGCMDSFKRDLVVLAGRPFAGFNVTDTAQCQRGNAFDFNNTSQAPVKQKFYWDFNDGTFSTDTAMLKTFKDPGVYNVRLTTTVANGCRDTVSHIVKVHPHPVATYFVNDSVQCSAGNAFFLNDTSTITEGSILQQKWDLVTATYTNYDTFTHRYEFPGIYPLRLIVVSERGCADTTYGELTVDQSPGAGYTVLGKGVCKGETKLRSVDVSLPYTFQWMKDGVLLPDTSREITLTESGIYRLIVNNDNKCIDTSADSSFVVHEPPLKPVIQVNGFTLSVSQSYEDYEWYYNSNLIPLADIYFYVADKNGYYRSRVFSEEGCDAWSDSVFIGGVSVNPISKNNQLNIYPNPSTGLYHIANSGKAVHSISIHDQPGKTIMAYPAQTSQIDLTGFAAGCYYARVWFEDGSGIVVRLVKY